MIVNNFTNIVDSLEVNRRIEQLQHLPELSLGQSSTVASRRTGLPKKQQRRLNPTPSKMSNSRKNTMTTTTTMMTKCRPRPKLKLNLRLNHNKNNRCFQQLQAGGLPGFLHLSHASSPLVALLQQHLALRQSDVSRTAPKALLKLLLPDVSQPALRVLPRQLTNKTTT